MMLQKRIKTLIYLSFKNILIALPYALLITIIINVGSFLQFAINNLLNGNQGNLYDSVYDGLIGCCQNNSSIVQVSDFLLLAINIFLIIFFINKKNFKKVLLFSSLFIFFILNITDYLYSFYYDNMEKYNFLTNLIYNFFGALLITLVLIFAIDFGERINTFFENQELFYRRIIKSTTAILIGIFFIFITLLMYKNIFTITKSRITCTIKPPIYGTFLCEQKNPNDNLFGLNTLDIVSNMSFGGLVENFSLNSTIKEGEIYNAEVRILDGCLFVDEKQINNLLLNQPTYIINDIKNINISTENKFIFLNILGKKSYKEKIIFPKTEGAHINIEQTKKQLLNLSFYLSNKQKNNLQHTSWDKEISYFISFQDVDLNNKQLPYTIINIHTNKNNKKLYLKNNKKLLNKENDSICKVFNKLTTGNYNLTGMTSGIILTIKKDNQKPDKVFDAIENNTKNNTTIKGIKEGEFYFENITPQNVGSIIKEGNLSSLNFVSKIDELFIDGIKHNTIVNSLAHITILNADLNGQATREGMLKFNGSSKFILIDENRKSLTRWEKIGLEYQLAILGFIFSLLVGFIIFLYKWLKNIFAKNQTISL